MSRHLSFISAAACLLLGFSPAAGAKTLYAAPTGSGSSCSLASPCALNTGLGQLAAGDTLYLRGGTYPQVVWFGTSGLAGAPIVIAGYPGETAVVDGNDTLPASDWGALFSVTGDYVTVRDIEVARSLWMGLVLRGAHDLASNVESHGHWENGILLTGDYGLAEGCRVHDNARSNVDCLNKRGNWASGLSAARHPTGCVLRGNTVWHNWGEGLSTYEATNTTIEDNVAYDNYSVNLYLSDATDVLAQRNLIYATGAIGCGGAQVGIAIGSEAKPPSPARITVVNNLVYHTKMNFSFWSADNAGLVNDVIAYNTFVDSTSSQGFVIHAGGTHANTTVENNIVDQSGVGVPGVCSVTAAAGVTFSHNAWSSAPCAGAGGAGDVIGDPRLERSGPIGAGVLTPGYFRLQANSPARDQAAALAAVPEDFFRNLRGTLPDVGAHEYGGGGATDAGVTLDAGDGGGPPLDAGSRFDSGGVDSGQPADGASVDDAGVDAGAPTAGGPGASGERGLLASCGCSPGSVGPTLFSVATLVPGAWRRRSRDRRRCGTCGPMGATGTGQGGA